MYCQNKVCCFLPSISKFTIVFLLHVVEYFLNILNTAAHLKHKSFSGNCDASLTMAESTESEVSTFLFCYSQINNWRTAAEYRQTYQLYLFMSLRDTKLYLLVHVMYLSVLVPLTGTGATLFQSQNKQLPIHIPALTDRTRSAGVWYW